LFKTEILLKHPSIFNYNLRKDLIIEKNYWKNYNLSSITTSYISENYIRWLNDTIVNRFHEVRQG
jgi:hypothetical protein